MEGYLRFLQEFQEILVYQGFLEDLVYQVVLFRHYLRVVREVPIVNGKTDIFFILKFFLVGFLNPLCKTHEYIKIGEFCSIPEFHFDQELLLDMSLCKVQDPVLVALLFPNGTSLTNV